MLSIQTLMATFAVDPVKKASAPLKQASPSNLIMTRIGVNPESFSQPSAGARADATYIPVESHYGYMSNAFLHAVHLAYALHYPLALSPDVIWMCIAEGFGHHVNQNAEKLRSKFVAHEGKKELKVRRDDFVKGSPHNPWPEVFAAFSQQIRSHIGAKTHDAIVPGFSTTGPVEKAAAEVVLMFSMKKYFAYTCMTSCGIPEITLEGTAEDWKKLRAKAMELAEYDLQWWTEALEPILDQFVDAAEGKVDGDFWSSVYKHHGVGSGDPFISGWVITLFPYVGYDGDLAPNTQLESWDAERPRRGMLTTSHFPAGVVSTPFKWEYFSLEFSMELHAGFMMMLQDTKTLAIRPSISWAVCEAEEKKKEDSSYIL